MSTILVVTGFLSIVFWGLLRLRRIRESAVDEIKEPDKTMILIGLFYTMSTACLKYYRDHGVYPPAIIGDKEGLIEMGYLKEEPLAQMTSAVKLFSMVVSDKAGSGVCLAHATAPVTNEIITRIRETNGPDKFVDYKSGQFIPLASPVTRLTINLTMPLPLAPIGTESHGMDRIEEGMLDQLHVSKSSEY